MTSHAHRSTLQLATAMALSSALFSFTVLVVAIVVTPWSKVIAASAVNVGVTTTGIVVGAAAGAGLFIATPVAASYEIWAAHRRAVAFSAVQFSASVVGLLSGVWLAAIPVALSAVVLVLLLLPGVRSAMMPTTAAGRRWSVSVGYILLVSGGLWGLHNFYLRRAWAGVLFIGLLIFGAGSWGGLFSYLCFGALGVLLAMDAISMARRVRRLVQQETGRHWGRTPW